MRGVLSIGIMGLGLFIMGAGSAVAAPPAKVEMRLSSVPEGVAVFTVLPDGQDDFLCQTPCAASLPRGMATLKARHFGMREVVKQLDVGRAARRVTFEMAVLPDHTLVDVIGTIALDEVQIDGFTILSLPGWVVLPYGSHNALGKREGRTVWEYDFTTTGPRAEIVIGPAPPQT
ncbi:MAG: hypothetical protein IT385_00200 [Deltaproteobacteria bacterium]|nr:hypothetical protein [Deltaproteobacteria bacterium]